MRQAPADLHPPRPGLVLRPVRTPTRTVRWLRKDQAGKGRRPRRAAAMRPVLGRRRPRPGRGDSRRRRRARSPRRLRHGRRTWSTGRCRQRAYQQKLAWAIEAEPALLTGDGHRAPLRVIPRFVEHLHAARSGRCRPADLPRLPPGGAYRQAAQRSSGLPNLHRALPHRGMLTLPGPPRTRDPRPGTAARSAPTASSPTRRTWRPASAAGAAAGSSRRTAARAALPDLPRATGADLLHLRRDHACGISRATGRPWCPACQRRSATCSGCGRDSRRSPPAP